MSRNTAIAPEHALDPGSCTQPSNDDCDAPLEELDDGLLEVDDEVTLTMRLDEIKRLIELAFDDEPLDRPSTDDEVTIDRPTPVAPPPASQRLRALRMPAPARSCAHVTPALAQAARTLLVADDAQRRSLTQKKKTQLRLMAGMCATVLSS